MAPIYLPPSLPLPPCLDICNAALTAALMATGQFADVRSCWHSLLPSLTLDAWRLMPDRWQATFVASKRLPQHLHCLNAGAGAQCRLSGSHCATKLRRRRQFFCHGTCKSLHAWPCSLRDNANHSVSIIELLLRLKPKTDLSQIYFLYSVIVNFLCALQLNKFIICNEYNENIKCK